MFPVLLSPKKKTHRVVVVFFFFYFNAHSFLSFAFHLAWLNWIGDHGSVDPNARERKKHDRLWFSKWHAPAWTEYQMREKFRMNDTKSSEFYLIWSSFCSVYWKRATQSLSLNFGWDLSLKLGLSFIFVLLRMFRHHIHRKFLFHISIESMFVLCSLSLSSFQSAPTRSAYLCTCVLCSVSNPIHMVGKSSATEWKNNETKEKKSAIGCFLYMPLFSYCWLWQLPDFNCTGFISFNFLPRHLYFRALIWWQSTAGK